MFNPITSVPNLAAVQTLTARAFPRRRAAGFEILSGGLINTNLKVRFESNEGPVVLRIYRDGPDTCRKEVEVLRVMRGAVPVPEVLYAEPEGFQGSGAFSILEFIEGVTFQELTSTGNSEAIRQASYAVGQTLAHLGRYQFSKPGRLITAGNCGGLSVGEPYVQGPNPIPTILDLFLASPNCQRRAGADLVRRLKEFAWFWSPRLPNLNDDHSLVHSDFGNRNILVREQAGKWVVAAVIDWEFAFSGSPLLDVGHFLRNERANEPVREPYFSRAFVEHGGELPDDWRQLVRVIDLTALVERLTHDAIPPDIEAELLDLIHATLAVRGSK